MAMEDIMKREKDSGENISGIFNFTTVIDDMWKGFKKSFWILTAIVSLCASLFYFKEKMTYEPIYEAYTSFVVNTKTAYGYSDNYYNQSAVGQLNNTFPYILTSGVLEQRVAESLGFEKKVPATIWTEVIPDTSIFTIRVRAKTGQLAYDVLQATIKYYPTVAEYIIGETQLVKMDESGVSEMMLNPPNYKKDAIYGVIAGIIASMGILFLYAITKKTVRSEYDLQAGISVPYLGSIPKIKLKKRSKKKSLILMEHSGSNASLAESLRIVRSRIMKKIEKEGYKRILVTSAAVSEGKTTLAVNIALSMARKGKRVVLVDGDLRNPSVAKAMGLEDVNVGTADVLRGDADVMESLIRYEDTSLRVLPGTTPLRNPGKLLGSKQMEEMLDALTRDRNYVIVDTPPCGMLSDASVIARFVQGAVIVVRQDYARTDKIIAGIEHLVATGTELIGFVLNGTQVGITGYGYGYGRSYGYGYGYGYGHRKYGYGRRKNAYGYGEETPDQDKESEDDLHTV